MFLRLKKYIKTKEITVAVVPVVIGTPGMDQKGLRKTTKKTRMEKDVECRDVKKSKKKKN